MHREGLLFSPHLCVEDHRDTFTLPVPMIQFSFESSRPSQDSPREVSSSRRTAHPEFRVGVKPKNVREQAAVAHDPIPQADGEP
jgi:hypothetical protein